MATYPKLISDKKNPLKASDWFEKANDEVQFAYWVPNVSGGLVITMLPMDTDYGIEANIKYAQDAEATGFATALC